MSAHFFNNHTCLLIVQRSFGLGNIFHTSLDYQYYLKLLLKYKQRYGIKIFSFCLLPSAVYLIAGARDAGLIGKAVDETNNSFYEFAHATRDEKTAEIKICRSRVLVIGDEKELFDMIAFVESFPMKRGMVKREGDYEWTSFRNRAFGIEAPLIDHVAGGLF